jgi:protein TonB
MKAPPPPFIPPVEVQVQQPPPPQATISNATNVKPATTELQRPAPPAPAAAPAKGPSRSDAVVDFNTCARPEYPRSSQRNEEQGVSTISFLIGVDGRVMDSKLTKSSGFRDLDKAAQQALGKCRFKPAIVDGKPEQTWTAVQYVWTLE